MLIWVAIGERSSVWYWVIVIVTFMVFMFVMTVIEELF